MDIVVERQVFVAVLFEETERVVVAEIFELDERVLTVTVDDGRHEFVNQLVVSRPCDSFVSQSNVQRIV